MVTLWVLPPPNQSAWFAKIDWYLNWQMSRGLAHQARRPSVDLLRLTEEHQWPYEELEVLPHAPLLVSATGRLPADLCVVTENSNSLIEWLKHVQHLALRLKVQGVRIFLPVHIPRATAETEWKSLTPNSDLAVEFSSNEDAATWPNRSKTN